MDERTQAPNLMTFAKTALAASLIVVALGGAHAAEPSEAKVKVTRIGSQPSSAGPEKNFTGAVRVDSLFQAAAPGRAGGGIVTFEPGARTAWHSHPLGQTLLVTSGVGRVQQWGGPAEEIRPGDIVWIPPGVKHWHGASRTTGMSHVAIAESLNGTSTDWMEKVSDEQYGQSAQTLSKKDIHE